MTDPANIAFPAALASVPSGIGNQCSVIKYAIKTDDDQFLKTDT
jgi:hypothetical protein